MRESENQETSYELRVARTKEPRNEVKKRVMSDEYRVKDRETEIRETESRETRSKSEL